MDFIHHIRFRLTMQFSSARIQPSVYILIAALSGLLILATGCGTQKSDTPPGPPIPESQRAYTGPGTPIRFLGMGGNRFRPGADDPEYQEYLLWKEWKEYQRYREFQQSRNPDMQETESDGNQ